MAKHHQVPYDASCASPRWEVHIMRLCLSIHFDHCDVISLCFGQSANPQQSMQLTPHLKLSGGELFAVRDHRGSSPSQARIFLAELIFFSRRYSYITHAPDVKIHIGRLSALWTGLWGHCVLDGCRYFRKKLLERGVCAALWSASHFRF
jgi:hypothetical protein